MDVSIREVRYYRCSVIPKVVSLFFLIENIYLILSRYFFNVKKKVKNKAHLRLRYVRPILLRRSQYLSYAISNLIWEWESIAFHDMMMLIFTNYGKPTPKNVIRGRYLSKIEFKQAYNYVLFNCDELRYFIQ